MRIRNHALVTVLLLLASPTGIAEQKAEPTVEVARRVASYVDAFNRRDVGVAAKHWSKTGEYAVAGVKPIVGRKAIAAALKKLLATDEQFQLMVDNQRFRVISDDVVMEEGLATLVSETHGTEHARYLAVHVKENGMWFRDTIRETAMGTRLSTVPNPQSLNSLVGSWKYESDDATLTVKADWKHDKRFLCRAFQLQATDGQKVTATEMIGWDPASETFRSWSFDSQGGFEQAVWNRDGDSWLLKAKAVLPGGITATEQRKLSIDSDGNLRTQTLEQQFAGRLMPGSEPITLIRQSLSNVKSK